MLLSVLIPVYNERKTLATLLEIVCAALPGVDKELIVVDDCSSDGTRDWLRGNFPDGARSATSIAVDPRGNLTLAQAQPGATVTIRPLYHEHNKGKGGALQTALAAATGDVLVVQDADLEYDPQDWTLMLDLIVARKVADVVYGSRFHGRPHRSLHFHHYLANRLISTVFSLLYNQTLSDVEVCYKMFTRASEGHAAHHLQRLRVRAAAWRPDRARAALAHLRGRNPVLRAHLRRGQEDQLEGRREGPVVPGQVPLRPGGRSALIARPLNIRGRCSCCAAAARPRPSPARTIPG